MLLASVLGRFVDSTPARRFLRRLLASPVGMRLARGAFWSLVGSVISRGLNTVVAIPVARILGTEALGQLGVVQSTVGLFGVVAGLGVGIAVTKQIAASRSSDPDRVGRLVVLSNVIAWASGLLAAVPMALCSSWLARVALAEPALTSGLQLGAILVLLGALGGAQIAILTGLEAFPRMARANVVAGLVSAPIYLAGTSLWGLRGAVLGLVGGSLVTNMVNHFVITRELRLAKVQIRMSGWTNEMGELAAVGLPVVVASLITTLSAWACNVILVNEGSGYVEMGIINATMPWFAAVTFVGANLTQGILPALADEFGRGNAKTVRKVVRAFFAAAAAIATPLTLLGVGMSRIIMGFYGGEFSDGWPVLSVTMVGAWIYCFYMAISQTLLAAGAIGVWVVMNTISATCAVVATLLLVHHGAIGVASARAFAYLAAVSLGGVGVIRILRELKRQESTSVGAISESENRP